MNRFARWVVKHRVVVVVICLALMIPSIFGMASTRVKYDLLYYLPEELDTIKGQNILMEDFGKGAFSLCITEGLNEVDQADLEESIRGIPHVDTVVGYASALNGSIPSEILPDDIRGRFENGNDRIIATVFFDDTSSRRRNDGGYHRNPQEWRGEKVLRFRHPPWLRIPRRWWRSRKAFTSPSRRALLRRADADDGFVPAAADLPVLHRRFHLWNMGSNYLMGKFLYITKAVAAVLQLAVTLDYSTSIFLWHSYKEQKTLAATAMMRWPPQSGRRFSSIVGSSLTTVAGFVAICLRASRSAAISASLSKGRYPRRSGHGDAAPVCHPHDG